MLITKNISKKVERYRENVNLFTFYDNSILLNLCMPHNK